ncbi:unnamed protein product, partial [Onchocerca ochengi]|uniref:Uncharacterized protein n=1 Tax=Onchocerca ochengi TaxID=42157 RepID=A0A182EJP1_ONCOC
MRLGLYISTLEETNRTWLKYIQKITNQQTRKKEDKYGEMIDDNKGIINLISETKEAIISLNIYSDDNELALQRLNQQDAKELPLQNEILLYHATVNLPQFPLPTFNSDPKSWRQFWSSFKAAVDLQNIPNIKKLNYLMSCLNGDALLTVKGYDIAPENYDVIRKVLKEKYGNRLIIKKLLCNELRSIRRNDREWKTTIETMER